MQLLAMARYLTLKPCDPAPSLVTPVYLMPLTLEVPLLIILNSSILDSTPALHNRTTTTQKPIRRTSLISSKTANSKYSPANFRSPHPPANPLPSNTRNAAAAGAGVAVVGGAAGAAAYSSVDGEDDPEYVPDGYYLAEDGYYYPNDEGYNGDDVYGEGQEGYDSQAGYEEGNGEGQEGYGGQEGGESYEMQQTSYNEQPADTNEATYQEPDATKTEYNEPATQTRDVDNDNDDNNNNNDDDGCCCGCVVM